jgi:formylmethanofuran dehydrogenase subunit E
VPDEPRHYFAQLRTYQLMPAAELLTMQAVTLTTSIEALVSRPGVRVNCSQCGEEIINEREVWMDGQIFCRTCAGNSYYQTDGKQNTSGICNTCQVKATHIDAAEKDG